jgi:hypothetical protein
MEKLTEKSIDYAPPRWLDLKALAIVALAAAAVWCTSIAFGTWKSIRIKPEKRALRVTGSAKKRIVSDLIDWTAVLEAHAPDRTAAYKELRDETDRAVEFLKAQGVKPEEIRPSAASFGEDWETAYELKMLQGAKDPVRVEKRTFKGFTTRAVIEVQSHDVDRVEKASREITSLLEQGVSVTSSAPRYYYTRLGELKVEMLAAAGKDARARAENIIRSAGGAAIGKLKKADMGIINVNPANSTQTSEEGNNDTSSLDKDIITIVHAEFELE